ncbi:hypothetical protein RJ640_011451 [Escallonia rubra]|uniref:BI1-like protein n=1 Tax=Escallonia rubra TaxID=112253 RepID=A0AA88R1J9_9ASTE|nr:hypothetical protein RJ640_011451 [Escallonia rubra]
MAPKRVAEPGEPPESGGAAKACGGDVEAAGGGGLYPSMTEDPKMRWSFVRKVYTILSMQLLLTVGVAATVVFVRPIPKFLLQTTPGIVVFVLLLILPLVHFVLSFAMHSSVAVAFLSQATSSEPDSSHAVYHYDGCCCGIVVFYVEGGLLCHDEACTDLGLFLQAAEKGLRPTSMSGKVILEAGILTCVVVVSLTLYTFWAAKRGHDFQFLGPFLFTSLLMLIAFALIQIFIPLGKLGHTIYGCIGALIFSGFIIFDTDNLIKRFTYDEYITAAITLYLDILNLFLSIASAMDGGSSDNLASASSSLIVVQSVPKANLQYSEPTVSSLETP